ncbi:MAG: hypothetical protein P9L94_07000 [Candidatus Hinthialibacter antarcticus]|nr:hypothetical protein [Candidatus Hinthialibacter antarcticus]
MKIGYRLFALFMVMECFALPAFAQEGDFFDTYIPIAKLFDSPVFFACVVGSAVLILVITLLFILYTNNLEKKCYEWGKKKKTSELIGLLESPIAAERRSAFIYLRNHGSDDEAEELIINQLHEQRRNGEVNPYLIYLMEDLRCFSGIPVLKTINKSNSQYAQIAGESLAGLLSDQSQDQEKQSDKDKTK